MIREITKQYVRYLVMISNITGKWIRILVTVIREVTTQYVRNDWEITIHW